MELELKRYSSGKEDTLGMLTKDGKHLCFTLEDQYRAVKVKGDTRIPAGRYEIKLRKEGTHHLKYSQDKDFAKDHKGMLHLQDVPGFQYILIHVGNTDKDTEGCILLGSAVAAGHTDAVGRRMITGSRAAYKQVYPIIAGPLSKGEKVYITIKDAG